MGCCRRMSEAEKAALPECRANLRRNEPKSNLERCCVSFKRNLKFLLILGAVIIGVALGYFLRDVGPFRNPAQNPRTMLYFTLAAEIMTRILRFISLPVTISAIISGIANLNTKISVKVGVIIGLYFLATSILATAEGFLWIYVLNPGSNHGNNATTQMQPERYDFYYPDVLLDLVRNVFPDNFVTVAFETYHTSFSWKEIHPKGFPNETTFIESFNLAPTRRPNLLGVTVWFCLFGMFITYLGSKKTKPLAEILEAVYTVTSHMYRAFLWFYPVAVVLLVARLTLEMTDPVEALRLVSRFLLTVVVGEVVHFLVILPLIYWIFTRRNPFSFLLSVSRALIMALAASDSSLALPVTLECLDGNARMNSNISRYTLPLGVVFNKDGAAIYQVMVVVFFAKYRGINPDVWDLFIMGCVSLALSFGASHIRDGMIIYAVLFHTLQLPVEDLVLLFPVHWIMERLRVVVSVWSDCVGAAVADKLTRGDQELLNYRNSQYRLLKYDMMDTVKEGDYV